MSIQKFSFFAFATLLLMPSLSQAESKILLKSTFDPAAPKVEMFAAMKEEQIDVRVLPRDALSGALLITNKTTEPLTVQVPDGFVAVPANAQFGGGMGGMGGGGMGGMGGMGGGMGGMGGGGGQQSMGGGMGGGGMGGMGGGGMGGMGGMGGGGMGGGGGFFSIPADKTLRVPYTSVCLNHGLKDPTPRSKYRIIPVEQYTQDPALQSLIRMVGTGQLNSQAAQAATWNLANGLSWQQLASKTTSPIPGPNPPYFSQQQLMAAQNIVGMAQARGAELAEQQAKNPTKPTEQLPGRVLQTR